MELVVKKRCSSTSEGQSAAEKPPERRIKVDKTLQV